MTSDEVAVADSAQSTAYRTTEGPCIVCVIDRSLDDDRPRLGTVGWAVTTSGRLTSGVPVSFRCPNGHSSEDDPALLKAFRSRLFQP
jgi:hypothetical protein